MNKENNLTEQDKILQEFIESLKTKSKEELIALESEISKDIDEASKKYSKTMMPLPEENREETVGMILTLLDKYPIRWQDTLGAVRLYDEWDVPSITEISYPAFNTTLEILGGLTYTGYDEWKMVVAIDEYVQPLHDLFAEITNDIYSLSTKHAYIVQALELFGAPKTDQTAE